MSPAGLGGQSCAEDRDRRRDNRRELGPPAHGVRYPTAVIFHAPSPSRAKQAWLLR